MFVRSNHPAFRTLVARVPNDLKMRPEKKMNGTLASFKDMR